MRFLCLGVCLLAACYNPDLQSGHFACNSDVDCPTSMRCLNRLCVTPPAGPGSPADCRQILQEKPGAPSGTYAIWPKAAESFFDVHCDMSAEGGGWTLVLKANGSRSTFAYGSAQWTSAAPLNPASTALDDGEAKLASYSTVPFTQVRLGLVVGMASKYVTLESAAPSMLARMQGSYVATSLGRTAWKDLVAGASLQPNCNQEGFNVAPAGGNAVKVRIGIVGNEQGDCSSPDSGLGLGGGGGSCTPMVSVGNAAGCGGDAGNVVKAAVGFLFVR